MRFVLLARAGGVWGYCDEAAGQTAESALAAPVQLTAEQDHQHIMDLLHITS
jgi:hypothetical protein